MSKEDEQREQAALRAAQNEAKAGRQNKKGNKNEADLQDEARQVAIPGR